MITCTETSDFAYINLFSIVVKLVQLTKMESQKTNFEYMILVLELS